MSTLAMQQAPQRSQAPTSSSPYSTTTAASRQQSQESPHNRDVSYTNQGTYATNITTASRRQGRHNRHNGHNGHTVSSSSPLTPQQFYSPDVSSPASVHTPRMQPFSAPTTMSPQTPTSAASAGRDRNRSIARDQYDGPPIAPPRTSSQQANSPSTQSPITASQDSRTSSRHVRQNTYDAQNTYGKGQNHRGEYDESLGGRARDDAATAAASTTRSARKGPTSSEAPNHTTNTRERGQQPSSSGPKRSEAVIVATSNPPSLLRENSEVINRVIVSDPHVDLEREQERMAEAQPVSVGGELAPVTALGPVGHDEGDDVGHGGARRQDYSKSASRRKEVQFGEYILGQTLGEGEFGKVKLGWKKDGAMQVAIKLIRRETVATNPSRLPKIYREISILRGLTHPNIVRLHEMVETDRHIGIILEYASGGELFDFILNHRYLKDHSARRLFAQLVSGVGYLHKKGIVHRDLKLENLLLDRNRNIIITDFGFANTFNAFDELSDEIEYNLGNREFVRKYRLDRQDEKGMRRGDLMQTSCGSPCYAAPELVVSDSLYTGRKVDVWSCGVILYAMLAGYLPFDDDPANPEGDNINLLYKYITSTPLTFPEYVTPHARDLLRRILVPDPRKRADLFEVARHSWLSEYQHVVSHITSSTTNIADIANSTVALDDQPASPVLARSASVRQPTKAQINSSPVGALTHQPGKITQDEDADSSRGQRGKGNRHTLQPEYVAPQSHTTRGEAPATTNAPTAPNSARAGSQTQDTATGQVGPRPKPLPQAPGYETGKVADYPVAVSNQQKMPPPTRPGREVPRSVSDSTGAFATPAVSSVQPQGTRPSTGGSMTSASNTRSDLRLPSRGSYGQPVAPTVAATNAQGRVTQPKNGRAYNISAPIPQHGTQGSIGRPSTQQPPAKYNETPAAPPAEPAKAHHRRSSTFSGLSDRLFGRSGSVSKKPPADSPLQKSSRKYPPTSMKDPYPSDDGGRRMSSESKRSFSFGIGRKKSVDLESQEEKPTKRFSGILPPSFSFRGQASRGKEQASDLESQVTQAGEFSQSPPSEDQIRPLAGVDGQHRAASHGPEKGMLLGHDGQEDHSRPTQVSNFSRAPQQHQYHQPTSLSYRDAYGGNGDRVPQPQYQDRSYVAGPARPPAQQQYQQPNQNRPMYPEGFNSYDEPRSSMQQGRPAKGQAVLQKNNRKFNDAYGYEQGPNHHDGSSGPARKVMDFFRRRGRARVDSDYH